MGLLHDAIAHTDDADLVILSHVETIRDQMQPATSSAVASLIGGAPVREVSERMRKLVNLQALDFPGEGIGCQLTDLGCELLMEELVGWSPSDREQRRRDRELAYRIRSALGRG